MRTITMSVDELVATLTENAANHAAKYLEAFIGWIDKYYNHVNDEKTRSATISNRFEGAPLEARLATIAEYAAFDPKRFTVAKPQYHGEAYETALAMLEAHVDDTITVDQGEFEQYVLDRWGWTRDFETSYAFNTSYERGAQG